MQSVRVKVDPAKLPVPILPPTRAVRIDFPETHVDDETERLRTRRRAGLRLTREARRKSGNGRTWTYEEEQTLVDGLNEGVPEEQLAQILGRTVEAIRGRRQKIREGGRIIE